VRAHGPDATELEVSPADYPAEVKTLAQALHDAFARITAFVERERQFTANASHELRTPVTVIAGAVELLEARPDAGEPSLARPLQRLRRATAAMEETIEIFLLLAREDAVATTGPPVALRVVAEDVVDQLHHLIGDLPVVVEIDIPPTAHLAADQRVLRIVLGNLVRNALQRTERGQVRIAATEAGLEVSDTGPGIPAEILDRVTGRGVRGSSGGHGLGLAIVRTLCDRCGWRLSISSAEGEGTRITLQFD
jgi:signal transduction histidine kinase